MAHISMGEAARNFKVSKATLSRAISRGDVSFVERLPDGTYRLDPAEVARFMETFRAERRPVAKTDVEPPVSKQETGLLELQAARLEEQVTGLKALVDAERKRADAAEQDRDSWRDQAKTLAITNQAQTAMQTPPEPRRGLFGWLSGRKAANG